MICIVAGCVALAIVMLLPFAYSMGAVYGEAVKRATDQEIDEHGP